MPVIRLPNTSAFKDVPADSYAKGYIERGQLYGIVKGTTAETFGYGQNVTREEMVAFVIRAFERGIAVSVVVGGGVLIAVYYMMKKM